MSASTYDSRSRKRTSSAAGASPTSDTAPASGSNAGSPSRLSGAYAMGPAVTLGAPVQAKLTVGRPGDRYEREADQAADRVTSGQTAGEISRIPPGGLGAQRQPEESGGENDETGGSVQTLVQREPEAGAAESEEAAAQTQPEAQTRETSSADSEAQAKCAGCEAEEQAQRRPEEGDEASAQAAATGERQDAQAEAESPDEQAQAKCAGCEQEAQAAGGPDDQDAVQRQPEDSASSEAGTTAVQKQDEDGGAEAEEEGAEEAAEEGEAQGDDEDAKAPECPDPAGAAGAEEDEAEEGGEGGGETQSAESDLGCGAEGGEEEAPASEGGESSCGGEGETAAEEGGAGEGPEGGEEPAPTGASGAAPGGGAAPACAEEVPAEAEQAEESGAEGAAPAGGAEAQGECAVQTKVDAGSEEARMQEEDEAQAASEEPDREEEPASAQTQEEESEAEGAAQMQEEEGETQAASEEPEAQGREEEPASAQAQEEEAEAEGAAQMQEEEGETQAASEEPEAQGREEEPASAQTQEEEGETQAASEEPEAQGREEEPVSAQAQEEESEAEGAAQTRASGSRRRQRPDVAARHIQARGPGEPLAPSVRDRLESGLGVDLEGVRVHSDSHAHAAAKALRAKAFTHRQHIFLGPGHSQFDLSLMAHESTHVLQQDAIVRRKPKGEPDRMAGGESPGGVSPTERAPAPAADRPAAPAAGPAATTGAARPDVGAGAGTGAGGPEARSVPGARPDTEPGTTGVQAEPAATTGETKAVAGARGDAEQAAAAPKEDVPAGGSAGPEKPAPRGRPSRGAAEPDEAGVPAAAGPADDARFQGVMRRLKASARYEKSHAPAKQKAEQARAAVKPPENERPSRAEARQVTVMEQQPDEPPKPSDFLTVLRQEIERIAPRNMEQTLAFKSSGRAGWMQEALQAKVRQQRQESIGPLEQAAKERPDVSVIPEAQPVGIPAEPADPAPRALRATDVLPTPKPEAEISVQANVQKAEDLMAAYDIDEAQLERANDPLCTKALEAKRELEAHAEQVPAVYRQEEQAVLQDEQAAVTDEERRAKGRMRHERTEAKGTVRSKQDEAKQREEEERRKVAGERRAIYSETKQLVDGRLERLNETVGTLFERGERTARDQFETYVADRMRAYKNDRYSGLGKLRWVKDKIFGMPDEVNAFYVEGRERYIADMDLVLQAIARTVDTELAAAKDDIAKGKARLQEYDAGLEPRLQRWVEETQGSIGDDFADLEQTVDDQKDTLAADLAQRYHESRRQLDERIEELKKENQGLLDKFVDFLKKVWEFLGKLKDLAVRVLKAGGEVLRGILKDPSGFLGNLFGAVKQGFHQFRERFTEHLQEGLFDWISGQMKEAGIEAGPADKGPTGVFGFVLRVLGLTPERLRGKVVRLIGRRHVERIERAWQAVSELLAGGAAGLWERVKEHVSDLKERIQREILSWLLVRVIRRGIEFVLSLFSPVTALLRAIRMIYDLVMFFVENIDRIRRLVDAIIESISKVVAGNVAAAANWIEGAMARSVTMIIAFLARILRLSGIAGQVRRLIERVRRPIERAIDTVLKAIVRGVKAVGRKGAALARKGAAAVKRFLFPKRSFRAGSQPHRLFFAGTDPQAALMVASETKVLAGFVAELRTRPENKRGTRKQALDEVVKQIKNIDAARKQIATKPDQARARIDAALAVIAGELGKVLSAGEFATEKNPLALAYPKRASERYPKLFVGPKVGTGGPRIGQQELAAAESDPAAKKAIAKRLGPATRKNWEARGLGIERFDPHGKKTLPEGGETIGIDPQWQISVGKKLKLPPPRSTPGGGKINQALVPYGYSPKAELMDGDHVTEIQLGGRDEIPNLWPLDRSENRAAGSILKSATFTAPDGSTVSMKDLKQQAKKRSVWLVITSTK